MRLAPRLHARLFGAFALSWSDGEEVHLRSAKAQALVAMLATAPDGKRTRAWLQEALWGRSGEEHGRASLRQCLTAVRRALGPPCDTVVLISHQSIRLRTDCFVLVGSPADGEFLEGLHIREDGFLSWLQKLRASFQLPEQGSGNGESTPSAVAAARALPSPGVDRRTRRRQVPEFELETVALVSISMSPGGYE